MKTAFQIFVFITIVGCTAKDPFDSATQAEKPKGPNAYQKITGDDTDDERERWNTLYKTKSYVFGIDPDPFLREHAAQLPVGRALILPMEEGRNAVFLAKQGFIVAGVDFSEIALQKANRLAKDNGVKITGINADLNHYVIEKEAYDVIVDIDFHRPRLVQQIKQGLKKGGVVLYKVITPLAKERDRQVSRDAVLAPGALKEIFGDYQVLFSEEKIQGDDRVASLIAKKP